MNSDLMTYDVAKGNNERVSSDEEPETRSVHYASGSVLSEGKIVKSKRSNTEYLRSTEDDTAKDIGTEKQKRKTGKWFFV